MPTKSQLYALLNEINTLKQSINRIERRVKAMLAEGERKDQQKQDLTYTLISIINRLEQERGYAHIDAIVEQAVRAGFNQDDVERELDRILG